MKRLIDATIKNRQVTLLIALFIMCMGIYFYIEIPKQENPDTSSPAARIITVFPGGSPEDVEKLVTIPLEDAIKEVDGIEKIESHSYNSYSVVIIFLNYNTNKDEKWSLIRDKIGDVESTLPEGCHKPQMDNNLTEAAGIILSVSGENYSYQQLSYFAEEIKRSLEQVKGVKQFLVEGEVEKEVQVRVPHENLLKYKISLDTLANILKAQNLSIPSGSIQTKEGKIAVQTNGTFENIEDIENIVVHISEETGAMLRIRDMAQVHMTEKEESAKFKQNGENAVMITGFFEEDKNIVSIGKKVRSALEDFKNQAPKDLQIGEVLFLPEDVGAAVDDFTRNLLMSVVFVVAVILVGMGIRNAIVVAAAIPLSIMATFDMMALMRIDVQQMSIAALIVALGMLVDNAIVISDAIQVKLNEGMEKIEACKTAAKEQSVPVLTSTLTTIAAFAPLTRLSGEAGEFVNSLPMVVMIALSASYLVAMLVIPVIGKYIFKKKETQEKNGRLRRFFRRGLAWSFKHKVLSLGMALAIFIGAIFMIQLTTINLFPYTDKNFLYVDIYNEVKGDTQKTEELTDDIEGVLKEQKGVQDITTAVGRALPRFYITVSTYPPAQDFGQILFKIDLKKSGFSSREEMAYGIEQKLNAAITGGKAFVKMVELNEPGPDIEVFLSGDNRGRTAEVANEIEAILRNMEETKNVSNDVSPETYGYLVRIDSDKAALAGLSKYDVQKQINIALYGTKTTVYRKEGNDYDVVLKSDMKSISDLKNLTLFSPYQKHGILLKQVADIELRKEQGELKRLERQKTYNVTTNIKPGKSITSAQRFLEGEIGKLDTQGVDITYGGDKEVFDKYVKSIGIAAVFAVFVIYLILLFQFGSVIQPFIILGTIPLSLIGSILGMIVFRQEITLTVLLGVASLVGIVVNNAILLVDYINQERLNGRSIEEACKSSAERRLRPILLSTVTTVIGLVPLAIWGSSFIKPMAVALMSGLGVATFLTLIIIPTLYGAVIREKKEDDAGAKAH